jgi:hypothetical protein
MTIDTDKLEKLLSVVTATVSADGPQPAAFLVKLMAGYDPRERSSWLYNLVARIDLEDRLPTETEWTLLKERVLESDLYRDEPVTLDTSHEAARQLMEYLHPKLSRTTVDQTVLAGKQEVTPLTPGEVETFEDWFLGEF